MTLDFGILKSKTEEEGLKTVPVTPALIGDAKLKVISTTLNTTEYTQAVAALTTVCSFVLRPNSENHLLMAIQFTADIKRTAINGGRMTVRIAGMHRQVDFTGSYNYQCPQISNNTVNYVNMSGGATIFGYVILEGGTYQWSLPWGKTSYTVEFQVYAGVAKNIIVKVFYFDYGDNTNNGEVGAWV
jgi:hypothetical protein